MNYDVSHWLAQIQELQQQLERSKQACDEAYGSAANWHRLYEKEASQRRTEVHLAEQTISELKNKIQELQAPPPDYSGTVGESISDEAIAQQVEQWQTPEELKLQLMQVIADRDRLTLALQAEKEQHAHTRQSLTSALADAIEQLNKNRVQKEASDGMEKKKT